MAALEQNVILQNVVTHDSVTSRGLIRGLFLLVFLEFLAEFVRKHSLRQLSQSVDTFLHAKNSA